MAKLLIVESPSKIKTIAKVVGSEYKILASGGHVIDLPKSKLGVNTQQNFEPEYKVISGKKELLNELKKAAGSADAVLLGTDPDREGEAISWHLANALGIDLDQPCRVAFNEITPKAIKEGLQNPRPIDKDLVDAQQARRVLDRLVGYEISPILWRKIKKGLSAGRTQSPALRLIVEREREIENFVPKEYWSLDVYLSKQGYKTKFAASFVGPVGKKKMELGSAEEVNSILAQLEGAEYKVAQYKEGKRNVHAPAPFTTSLLQQEASRKLGFTTKRTMRIAQSLYEGVELSGEGAVGLVTYIRTDSVRISEDAISQAREYIRTKYGEQFLPAKPNYFKSKKNAQDAHEAIRPTSLARHPEAVRASLTDEQYKLYKLIFDRFIACQMANAIYATKTVDIQAADYIFRATASERVFDGFMAAYIEGQDDGGEEKKANLPNISEGEVLQFHNFEKAQHFTEPPARYNEASLVKELEENGIGRPSTFSTIVSTIIERGYVEREKKTLKPTPLGITVNDLMCQWFKEIVDVHFTAEMESKLDLIEEGERNWIEVLKEFYAPFKTTLERASQIEKVKVPAEETDVICEKCGRRMVIKSSRFGKFLACPGYPECKNTKPMPEDEVNVPCPKCGAKLLKKTAKKSNKKFYGCSRYPECDFAAPGVPTGEKCPECGGYLVSGFRGRVYCFNLSCPTNSKNESKTSTKSESKATGKTASKTTSKTTSKTAKAKTTSKKTKKEAN